jgi:hypothetical protein
LEQRTGVEPGSLSRELKKLLSQTSTAEAFACEASRVLAR